MQVPFVDLAGQYAALKTELTPAMEAVLARAAFILGSEVETFEREFAAFTGARECVSLNSGCDALLVGIKACGIGPGDEVIVPANTFIATPMAVSMAGATPVLVDCLESSYNMDPAALNRVITPRTKAIIPVHLYGQSADMDPILEIARQRNLAVIEDAAQAHGATYKGRNCGTMGRVGCFSFYPGKNLGAYGDGGAIVTNDPAVAEFSRLFRNYGQKVKGRHDMLGWNSRLDTVQAAILSVKLRHLSAWNASRHAHAARYREKLAGLPVVTPVEMPAHRHVYHLFVIRVRERERLSAFLKTRGVSCGIHYETPVHLQPAYADLGKGPGSFPCAEQTSGEILSLPMFPELTNAQIDYICAGIREFLNA